MIGSTPNLEEFDPTIIPFQHDIIKLVRQEYNYDLGVLEILMSGSVGSAKSLLASHLIATHCLDNQKAKFCIGRQSLPDLRETLLATLLEHLHVDHKMVEGINFSHDKSKSEITFLNGSKIISRTWGDKKYMKFRSLQLSGLCIEEAVENDVEEWKELYKEALPRVGRLMHVREQLCLLLTNPDEPEHPIYRRFIADAERIAPNIVRTSDNRYCFYSVTSDNPFLPQNYIKMLLSTYSPEEAQRMIYGKWVSIAKKRIYYSFGEWNKIKGYKLDKSRPVYIAYDFNIGHNKPMSVVFYQYFDKNFYFFKEIIIYSSRTLDTLEEAENMGILRRDIYYIVQGDAAGSSRTTNYNKTDYDVIREYLSGKGISHRLDVPRANPALRARHTRMNGLLKNGFGDSRIFVDVDGCPTLIDGFKLTKLVKGSIYKENDNDPWQHCTTAAGYGVLKTLSEEERNAEGGFRQFKQG